jgi:hypothetical protein
MVPNTNAIPARIPPTIVIRKRNDGRNLPFSLAGDDWFETLTFVEWKSMMESYLITEKPSLAQLSERGTSEMQ